MEEAREAVKKKNIVREMWTDGSVKEKENKAPGPGRGGGEYTITRWIDGVAEEDREPKRGNRNMGNIINVGGKSYHNGSDGGGMTDRPIHSRAWKQRHTPC